MVARALQNPRNHYMHNPADIFGCEQDLALRDSLFAGETGSWLCQIPRELRFLIPPANLQRVNLAVHASIYYCTIMTRPYIVYLHSTKK
jgi:hypothetical protein